MHNEQFKGPDIFKSPRLSQECTCPVVATVQYSDSVCSPSTRRVIYHLGWFHHCTPFPAVLLRSPVFCLSSGVLIAFAVALVLLQGASAAVGANPPCGLFASQFHWAKCSSWQWWCLVALRETAAMSQVWANSFQYTVHQLHPQLERQQLLPAGPPPVTPICSQVFKHKQPTAFSSHQTPFQL